MLLAFLPSNYMVTKTMLGDERESEMEEKNVRVSAASENYRDFIGPVFFCGCYSTRTHNSPKRRKVCNNNIHKRGKFVVLCG